MKVLALVISLVIASAASSWAAEFHSDLAFIGGITSALEATTSKSHLHFTWRFT